MFRNLVTATGLPQEGDQEYSTAGSYSFTVPTGVSQISVVCVGGGGGSSSNRFQTPKAGAGGGLTWATISVTPGESLTVVIGAGGTAAAVGGSGGNGGPSYVSRSGTVLARGKGGLGGNNTSSDSNYADSSAIVTGNYSGGAGGTGGSYGGGGGGAAGYSGNGGAGGNGAINGSNGAGGAAGGGGGGSSSTYGRQGGYGGRVGLMGEGASGAGGISPLNGGDGSINSGAEVGRGAPSYADDSIVGALGGLAGGSGGVRIVWPGQTRKYPSTNVA